MGPGPGPEPGVGPGPGDGFSIRAARPDDGPAVGAVFTAARASMTYLPALHTAAEDIEFFSGVVDAHGTDGRVVDVAESVSSTGGEVIGFSAVHHDWLDHLYVAPGWQGRGVGSALLARAQVVRPDRLILWVFEANERARAFYRRAGFIEMERTDGRDNMEKVPDVLMRWTGATS